MKRINPLTNIKIWFVLVLNNRILTYNSFCFFYHREHDDIKGLVKTLVATFTITLNYSGFMRRLKNVWLWPIICHIQSICELDYDPDEPIVIYEDNIVIDQIKHYYIKEDTSKHISPKLFFTNEQQTFQKIKVQHNGLENNHVDLFTKSLS